MRNGFYILQEQYKGNMSAFLEKLDNIEAELPIPIDDSGDLATVSVGSFLQGFCGELAKYFHRECTTKYFQRDCSLPFGILYDPNGKDMRLFHVFNVFAEGSTMYYLDARGITDDYELFIAPFSRPGDDLKLVCPFFETDAKAMFGDEWDFPEDNISDAMIRWLLTSFPENFKHPALSPAPPLNEQIQAAAKRSAAVPPATAPVRIKWIREEAGSYHSEDGRFSITNVYDRILGDHWSLWDRKTNQTYEKDTLRECKWVAEGHILPHERQKAQTER